MSNNTPQVFLYENTLSFIYSFYHSSRSRGLRPAIMKQVINGLGINSAISPHGVVQITGTNGKGTCARQVEADLIASGRDVITLISPHMTTFRERVRLNGFPISREMLGDIVESLAKGLESLRVREISPTPVEIAFLVALRLRINRGPETCLVLEAGRGGATDYTNVFNRTIVGLTRIGRDHLDLFHDLIGVAREKVGLSNSGGILVSVNQPTEVKDMIKRECESRNIKIEWLVMHPDPNLSPHVQAWRENQALANRLSQMVVTQKWKLGNVDRRDPWRFETRQIGGRSFILDGSHNPDAIQLLLNSLRTLHLSGWTGIFGIQVRKLYVEVVKLVIRSGIFKKLLLVQGCRGDFVSPKRLSQLIDVPFFCANSMRKALAHGLTTGDDNIVVFGSFSLAYDFERALHELGLGNAAIPADDIDPHQPWMKSL